VQQYFKFKNTSICTKNAVQGLSNADAGSCRVQNDRSGSGSGSGTLLELVLGSLFGDLLGIVHLHLARGRGGVFVVFVLAGSDGLALALQTEKKR